MSEKPILFSGPMFRAIIAGRKTQTRRICKDQQSTNPFKFSESIAASHCPYGQPGDRLWVRETWQLNGNQREDVVYRATANLHSEIPWKPSIFMPRWASRLTLEITRVRVERVQDISEKDAKAEGTTLNPDYVKQKLYGDQDGGWTFEYRKLWDSINAKRGFGWFKNPWVWVIEFTVQHPVRNQSPVPTSEQCLACATPSGTPGTSPSAPPAPSDTLSSAPH